MPEEYRFTAEKVTFQEEGYIVKQILIRNGEIRVEQFIKEDDYKVFCDAIGQTPDVLD